MQLDLKYPDLPTDDEQTILSIVRRRQGRERAIGAADLARITGIPARRIRAIVRRLRVSFHQPIGSTPSDPAGYYFCVSQDELMEFTQTWWDFGIQQLVMVSRLRKFMPDEFLNQIRLSLTLPPPLRSSGGTKGGFPNES